MEPEQREEPDQLLTAFINGGLCTAATKGNTGLVVALMDKLGADKNCKDDDGDTPLIKAASHGHLPVIETLLAAGADFTITGECGWSAIHKATLRGFGRIVVALMDAGADKNVRCSSGITPLMQAVYRNQPHVFKILMDVKADVNATDSSGYTALYYATRDGSIEAVHALLRAGADVNIGNPTPLMAAADKDDCSIIETLLEAGANVNIRSRIGWGTGRTALHFAAQRNNVAHVSLLLRWGADETALTEDGKTPADFNDMGEPYTQAWRDRVERVRLLLARAPADRAWRRRGWLVMLRSRTLKAGGEGGGGGSSADGGFSSDAGARSVKQRGGSGGGKEGFDLSAAVAQLGVVDEGVFRNIVKFL